MKHGILMPGNKIKTSVLCFVLAFTMVLAGAAVTLPGEAYASDGTVHYLAVASDRHDTPTAIATAMTGMPDSVEYVCLDGDMTDADRGSGKPPEGGVPGGGQSQKAYNTSTLAEEINAVFPDLTKDQMAVVYGSHDANATDDAGIMKCANTSVLPAGADSDAMSAGFSGPIYTGPDGSDADDLPDYYVYGVSYYDMQKAVKASVTDEKGASTEIERSGGEAAAAAFRTWVDGINESDPDVPIIVVGHVPLHQKRGDNLGATYWSAAFNYAATGSDTPADGAVINREVVYLHGHNHTVESTEYFIEPGGTITLQGTEKSASTESAVYYTYITAGYLRDNHTATLIKVDGSDLSFTKYKGCVITFDSAGGSEIESQTAQLGGTVSRPADPSREGWVFTGWYTEPACENAYDFSGAVTDDLTLYAGWLKGTKASAPSISTKVNASKKKAVISWTADAAASDYRVSYRKAGEAVWKRKWANSTTGCTVTGLEKKGLYEFRANAASESGNSIIYSDDSATVFRYISSLSKVKAKAGKKRFKLSWKKDGKATGYEVKYSAAKSMKNAVTVSIGSTKKTCSVRGLKSGKKYYIRVRPVVNSGGSTYYGAWSAVRTVKTK